MASPPHHIHIPTYTLHIHRHPVSCCMHTQHTCTRHPLYTLTSTEEREGWKPKALLVIYIYVYQCCVLLEKVAFCCGLRTFGPYSPAPASHSSAGGKANPNKLQWKSFIPSTKIHVMWKCIRGARLRKHWTENSVKGAPVRPCEPHTHTPSSLAWHPAPIHTYTHGSYIAPIILTRAVPSPPFTVTGIRLFHPAQSFLVNGLRPERNRRGHPIVVLFDNKIYRKWIFAKRKSNTKHIFWGPLFGMWDWAGWLCASELSTSRVHRDHIIVGRPAIRVPATQRLSEWMEWQWRRTNKPLPNNSKMRGITKQIMGTDHSMRRALLHRNATHRPTSSPLPILFLRPFFFLFYEKVVKYIFNIR